MLFIQKLLKYKKELIIAALLITVYFFIRIYNIMSLPLFTDEAIYTRWSQIARFDAAWRFISLTDGKQPSFVWLTMTVMKFIKDPLFAGRIISVFAGFGSMVGLYFLGKEIFKNRWIGIISAFLYLIFPMALVYDRMALYDTLVGTCMIWALYISVLLVRKIRLDVALILGMVMGAGVLTKTSAFFSMPLLFMTFLLFDFKQKLWKEKLLKLVSLSLLSIVMGFVFYSILRLSPFYHIINDKNAIFAYPLNEWLRHPLLYFVSNFRGLFDWMITYLTSPLLFVIFGAFMAPKIWSRSGIIVILKTFLPFIAAILLLNLLRIYNVLGNMHLEIQNLLPFVFFPLLFTVFCVAIVKKYDFWREKTVLVFWFATPFIYLAFFGNTIYPRFILFMLLPLLPLAAFSIYRLSDLIKNRAFFAIAVLVILAFPLYTDYLIDTNIAVAPIPKLDSDQYINNWPSGGGAKEIISYLGNQSQKGKIYVASLGTFGSLPTYAVEIYLGDDRNVEKRGIYPVPSQIPQDLIEKAKIMPVFVFVSNQPEFETDIKTWPLMLIAQYQKGVGKAYSKLYKVNP